jgi:hypothetical protein
MLDKQPKRLVFRFPADGLSGHPRLDLGARALRDVSAFVQSVAKATAVETKDLPSIDCLGEGSLKVILLLQAAALTLGVAVMEAARGTALPAAVYKPASDLVRQGTQVWIEYEDGSESEHVQLDPKPEKFQAYSEELEIEGKLTGLWATASGHKATLFLLESEQAFDVAVEEDIVKHAGTLFEEPAVLLLEVTHREDGQQDVLLRGLEATHASGMPLADAFDRVREDLARNHIRLSPETGRLSDRDRSEDDADVDGGGV